ncbi:uncharacterized protein [Littorina saxatilis]
MFLTMGFTTLLFVWKVSSSVQKPLFLRPASTPAHTTPPPTHRPPGATVVTGNDAQHSTFGRGVQLEPHPQVGNLEQSEPQPSSVNREHFRKQPIVEKGEELEMRSQFGKQEPIEPNSKSAMLERLEPGTRDRSEVQFKPEKQEQLASQSKTEKWEQSERKTNLKDSPNNTLTPTSQAGKNLGTVRQMLEQRQSNDLSSALPSTVPSKNKQGTLASSEVEFLPRGNVSSSNNEETFPPAVLSSSRDKSGPPFSTLVRNASARDSDASIPQVNHRAHKNKTEFKGTDLKSEGSGFKTTDLRFGGSGFEAANLKMPMSFNDVGDIDHRLLAPRTTAAKCRPHHHVAFSKVHKAASSTVANILQRYGVTRNLNFALPNKQPKTPRYNYISHPGEPLFPSIVLPPPVGQRYDILWNHVVYNRTFLDMLMPADTVYISILREPFQQAVSAFMFYKSIDTTGSQPLKVHPFSLFLDDETQHAPLLDYYRNKQSQDLGMEFWHVLNASLRHGYLQQLNRDFPLVMITEFFDESLVLLRRLLCWSVKDILYMNQNENRHKPSFVFSAQDYAKHRELAEADYELYEFFRRKFLRTLAAQSVDFAQEVNHFREVLQLVHTFCESPQVVTATSPGFVVPRSPWSEPFFVTRQDCHMLALPELPFLDILLTARLAHGDLIPVSFLQKPSDVVQWSDPLPESVQDPPMYTLSHTN